MKALIKTDSLTKYFASTVAVKDLDLEVFGGEIYGFLGPNGSGKTTTIKMLAGLLEPSYGSAKICGHSITDESTQAKALTAYVPDHPQLYGKLSAREFLYLMADLYRMPKSESRRHAEWLLDLFGLSKRADELLEGFSHGMKQKVILASALIHRPRVFLMDEPTTGLDPASARLFKELLLELTRQGAAVFVSTHILEIAERLCHRVGILKKGKLIAQGSPKELQAERGEGTGLEDIFLELTGGKEYSELIKSLGGGK